MANNIRRIKDLTKTATKLEGYMVLDSDSGTYKYDVKNIADSINGKYLPLSGGEVSGNTVFSDNVVFGSKENVAGNNSVAMGENTYAIGDYSIAEGGNTSATNIYAHAEGEGTIADGSSTHAQGTYNTYENAYKLFVIGNGTDDDNRSDAFIVDDDGSVSATNFYNENGLIEQYQPYVDGATAFF